MTCSTDVVGTEDMRGTYLTTLARQLTRVVRGLPAGRAAEEFVLPAVLGAMGQTLHCTDGVGLVVARDGTVISLHPGDTVWTAPGEEHWHGACADT